MMTVALYARVLSKLSESREGERMNCPYCSVSTTGEHNVNCPNYIPKPQFKLAEPQVKPFVLMYLRCPWCHKDMEFHGYKIKLGGKDGS